LTEKCSNPTFTAKLDNCRVKLEILADNTTLSGSLFQKFMTAVWGNFMKLTTILENVGESLVQRNCSSLTSPMVVAYPLTNFEGGLQLLYRGDTDTVRWPESTVTKSNEFTFGVIPVFSSIVHARFFRLLIMLRVTAA